MATGALVVLDNIDFSAGMMDLLRLVRPDDLNESG
jgi:hypothetical protein